MTYGETIEFVSGLDLGQANEFTALTVLEKRSLDDDLPSSVYSVRHLERFPIGTTYSAIFDRVSTLFSSMVLPENTLVVDQTAVGAPVMRLLRRANLLGGQTGVVITNGLEVGYEAGYWLVPKKDLVGTLQVLLQEQRLKIASQLPDVPTLVEELLNFQMKPAPPSADPLTAWREGPQDDLLYAIAIAAWWLERERREFFW